jgi:tetratricopeptide (TPR) repeat protein
MEKATSLVAIRIFDFIIMFLVNKFLLFLLLVSSLAFAVDEKVRSEFLFTYYNGDYEKAHSLLNGAIEDPVSRQIWEQRIHLQCDTLPACSQTSKDNKAARGIALLRIGRMKEARESFENDWLSLIGLANLAWWQNDRAGARQYVQQALAIAPDNPEVIYAAGDYAPNPQTSIDFFTKFLGASTEDPVRRRIAEYSIEFMKKTSGMELNVPTMPSGMEAVESQFKDERLLIKTKINEKEKATLILDTGSGGLTLVDREWQPKIQTDMLLFGLGKTQSTKSSRVVLDKLDAGNLSIKNAVASVSYTFDGDGVQGIAGTALFSNYLVLVPMKSGKDVTLFVPCEGEPLSCVQKNGFNFSNQVTFPFYTINKLIVVKGRIKNSDENMDILIDTGAARSLISTAAAKRWTHIDYALSRQMNSDVVGLAGKEQQTLVAENVEVQIGPLSKTYNRMLAVNMAESNEGMQLELDLILGRDFLNGYSLLIDYRHNQISFLK